MSHPADHGEGPHLRHASSTTVLQNRAFVELSRVLQSGDAAVMSSALPLVVRGASVPSAAIYGVVHDELCFVAAESVPLKLRACLEEPTFSGAPELITQRAFKQRRTIIDTNVFGPRATAGVLAALDEASWQCAIAVPILVGSVCGGVLLAGSRTSIVDGGTLTFLEAMASVLGAAAFKPSKAPAAPHRAACSGCISSVVELLAALGGEVAVQHKLLRDLCAGKQVPPEADALLARSRTFERTFRRLSEAMIRLPATACGHVKRAASMASVIDVAVQAARPALTAARAELEVVCAPVSDFEGDPELVAAAVRHLLVNAAESFEAVPEKASVPTSPRGVRVCVRSEGNSLAVHVEDSGPGVPQDLRARVFEPSITTKGPGRGLGLAVARHVVEGLGGFMELGCSELGGTRASLFIPATSALIEELRRAPTLQVPVERRAPRARA